MTKGQDNCLEIVFHPDCLGKVDYFFCVKLFTEGSDCLAFLKVLYIVGYGDIFYLKGKQGF